MKTNILNSPCTKTNIWQSIFRILLGSFMVYAGTGHLLWLRTEFVAQVPTWLPLDTDFVVLASGGVEILLGKRESMHVLIAVQKLPLLIHYWNDETV